MGPFLYGAATPPSRRRGSSSGRTVSRIWRALAVVMLDLQKETHRRYNPLTGEWVLVSPGRMDRPWQGEVSAPATDSRASFDPDCYLCPGNSRANGSRNPAYERTFVFENDFPAMTETSIDANHVQGELIRAESE